MCFSPYGDENAPIESINSKKVVVGMKQTLNAIAKDELSHVFVAFDADAFVTGEIVAAAEDKKIPIRRVESMKRLGKQCKIDTGASCAGVLW